MVVSVKREGQGERSRPAVGGGVWAGGELAERHLSGWWLLAAGLGPERGHDVGEIRGGGDVPVAVDGRRHGTGALEPPAELVEESVRVGGGRGHGGAS
jgi:hypothetical protein